MVVDEVVTITSFRIAKRKDRTWEIQWKITVSLNVNLVYTKVSTANRGNHLCILLLIAIKYSLCYSCLIVSGDVFYECNNQIMNKNNQNTYW